MKPIIHNVALTGFSQASEYYQASRPGYPHELMTFMLNTLGLTPDAHVVDVGAGTGKLTALLAQAGFNVTAIEPIAAMRSQLKQLLPLARVLDGTAEAMPLQDAMADVVIAAQAFHWFDGPAALEEIFRVLKPGGTLILVWNIRDNRVPWVAGYENLLRPYQGNTPSYHTGHWKDAFTNKAWNTLQQKTILHSQPVTVQSLIQRALSTSYIAVLPLPEQEALEMRIASYLANCSECKGQACWDLPYRTEIYWCRRLNNDD